MRRTMRNRFWLFSLMGVVMLLSGCISEKGRPNIEEEKMTDMLTEYYLLQAAMAQHKMDGKLNRREYYYSAFLLKHGVSEAEFDSAIVWYTKNMDVFEPMYDEVLRRLEHKKDSLEALFPAAPAETNP